MKIGIGFGDFDYGTLPTLLKNPEVRLGAADISRQY
jgi:hypothetical protein